MMGCSNPHPHGQAWSLSYIPTEAQTLLDSLKAYHSTSNGKNLLLDYAQAEIASQSPRVIVAGEHFAALTPYWAVWPYETIICPTKRRIANVAELTDEESTDLASVLRKMTCRFDNRKREVTTQMTEPHPSYVICVTVFQCSFPYSMGIYQQPTLNDREYAEVAQLHFTFSPPLLRSASVRKFLVG